MDSIGSKIKNTFKEIILVLLLLAIAISFTAPIVSIWAGIFDDSMEITETALIVKTDFTENQLKETGSFVWDFAEEEESDAS